MKKEGLIRRKENTSWQNVAKWYKNAVGESGLYFHQTVILPKSKKLLDLKPGDSLLDLACGQGILSKYLHRDLQYQGIDISEDLIRYAKNENHNRFAKFDMGDITEPLPIKKDDFSHAAIILALQNVEDFRAVFQNASRHLKKGGKFLIVLNHPYFRIPRQSSWEIDNNKKIQYRRLDRYLSFLKIPINMNPGSRNSKMTWSYHYPLQDYISGLSENGFMVEKIEEWISEKTSVGKASKMENRARSEFPLFMAILARKI